MKIAQVITRMDWGGAPDIVRIMCERLQNDTDVKLITGPSEHPSEKTKAFLEKFKDKTIIIPELKREITNPISDFIALNKLKQIFKEQQFDVVHTNTAKAGFLGRIAAKQAGVKYVVHTPHGHNFYGYFNPLLTQLIIFLEKTASKYADKIIALTELEKKDMAKFKVAAEAKIEVVHTGLELERFSKAEGADRKRIREMFSVDPNLYLIGMAGRLEHVKGPEFLLEAAAYILDERDDVQIIFAGEGPLKQKLIERCKEIKNGDKVIFAGWREDVPALLSVLDILVLPSLNEAVGNILIEAAASSLPAIAANVGGVSEIIKDGETGLLVEPHNAEAIGAAILHLIRMEAAREKLGKTAKEWARQNFEAGAMYQRVLELYRRGIHV
ncbi:glycosyltransferase family 4 protein [Candidatus Margulisiibacteriota bacterium]